MESKFSAQEREILKFWEDNKIFAKSVAKEAPRGDFVFYDGPPFATGLPHYGHFVPSIMKDAVPRYKTMRGFKVERRWGWDCHGLPIENIVEKELGFKTKKEIINYGIDKFNEKCRSKVLEFAQEWKKTIPRLGRWVDMDKAYKTMDLEYMESVWWVFKELWDRGLIYEGYRSIHVCPRCETTLSQQEVSEGYKDIKDLSVVVKFELVDEPGTFVLAWTTTPWTLPGNVALAVGEKIEYVIVKLKSQNSNLKTTTQNSKVEERYILARDIVQKIFEGREYEVIEKIKAKDLVGKKYKPLFCYYLKSDLENKENLYTIIYGDFVNTSEGTGVVHIAPAFGEDDMNAGKENNLPFIQHVNMDGTIKEEATDFAGMNVKPIDDTTKTDGEIIKNLTKANLLFSKESYTHSYPHCWRCDTPLINYATTSWFVKVTEIKSKALKQAKKINWSPGHIKEGRFGKWLSGARDWSISRQRFWASVMPIWKCARESLIANSESSAEKGCGAVKVFGSVKELEELSGKKITDIHKHIVDEVSIPCQKCGGVMRRIPDVLDTWFDSGSMPYAQMHYPFENKKRFEENFPAEFIAEATDQTRAWFYYLHIIATAIKGSPAFKNVTVNGIVLAEDGKKMAKKLNNYPDPNKIMDDYGADALRYYLLTTPVTEAESINFSEKEVKESLQKNIMLLGNILSFYQIYQNRESRIANRESQNILDRWILAKLNALNKEVTERMENYDLVKAARPISGFINELSTWYVRRSRERFRDGDKAGVETLGFVLREFSKLIAPFIPFTAEIIYKQVSDNKESVHLEDWPKVDKKLIDEKLLEEMELARKIVEKALAARYEAGIKIRQPIAALKIKSQMANLKDKEELLNLIKDEVNVKEILFVYNLESEVEIDTVISERLKKEGQVREIIRQINNFRKESKLTIHDEVILYQEGFDDLFSEFGDEIKKATLVKEVKAGRVDLSKKVEGGIIGIEKS